MEKLTRRGDIGKFIEALMAPPVDAGTNTAFNAEMRKGRMEVWMRVWCKREFYRALFGALLYTSRSHANRVEVTFALPPLDQVERLYKEAFAEQLLTPAPSKDALAWKLRYMKTTGWGLRITREEAKAAIAADEEFLAAHPVRRRKATGGKGRV
ncbi:hypothetical protein ACTDI4_05445 [Mesorhizobium sp. PUT5]|uniref:hypothetical protein n=1 Tax=Mesorhizobium sp. PUT5 TaxID=3454629 RepID=UPI003FA4CFF8